jgi:hypothetical protein
MCRRFTCLVTFVSVLIMTGHVSAELVGHWRLDDGSGTIAADSSGYGNDGTLRGDPQWVIGKINGALEFDGTDDYVEVADNESLHLWERFTLAAWIYQVESRSSRIIDKIGAGTANGPHLDTHPGTKLRCCSGTCISTTTDHTLDEWHHVAVTFDQGDVKLYVDGSVEGEGSVPSPLAGNDLPLRIGADSDGQSLFHGLIDDVRVYNQALTETEILAAMEGSKAYPYAFGPDPKDGALHKNTWVTLGWRSGDFAVSHDVYLGDNFNDVSEATRDSNVFWGNQTTTFYVAGFPGAAYPDGLVPGTTYYWRIDEVNETDPNSPWKGDVWSFSIPPKTAYNPNPVDAAEFVGPDDVTLSWTPGFGAKLHTVYFDDDFDTVNDATGGSPGGLPTYAPGPLELEKVYYWRVDEFDAAATYKGDVWSFTTPGAIGNPKPAYRATDVGMNTILRWTAADSATSHQLYFGTDKEAVRAAGSGSPEDKGSIALGAESYEPGLLEADTVYYWRVDEVDSQGNTSKGPLWVFTTGAFLLVEDFESYTDDDAAGQTIWQTWIDGFGIADNGAQVGYLMPPYCEQTIVHGGFQSMPLVYTNEAGVTNSEASLTLTAPRDWTQAGVTELSLWFRGAAGNAAEPLYTSISNTAGSAALVPYDDPGATTIRTWRQWRIPLQGFADQGISLSNVDKLAIGLGSESGMAAVGGSGTIYIDDIRLYRPAP